jgi:hypothetical protein
MATRNDNTHDVAREAANAGEQTARAGADMARRSAETARDTLQSGLNTATETFQRINDQFTRVLGFSGPQVEEVTRRSSENIQAVSQASSVLVREPRRSPRSCSARRATGSPRTWMPSTGSLVAGRCRTFWPSRASSLVITCSR